MTLLYEDLTYKIIGLAMEVHNQLGYGFLEKVYENSLMILFERDKKIAEQQKSIPVYFYDNIVGDYYADIIVDNKIILELKSAKNIDESHIAQTLNYLKATKLKVGMIINFGKEKLEHKRLVL